MTEMTTKQNNIKQRFINGLWENERIKYDKTFMNTWKYCGGDGNSRNGMENTIFKQNSHLNYWIILFGGRAFPETKSHCVCNHWIVEQCYITNDMNNMDGRLIVIGNCCIQKFLGEENKGRTCKECGAAHKNRKDSFCKNCRVKKADKIKQQKEARQAEEFKRQMEKMQEQARRAEALAKEQEVVNFWKATLKTQQEVEIKKCEKKIIVY